MHLMNVLNFHLPMIIIMYVSTLSKHNVIVPPEHMEWVPASKVSNQDSRLPCSESMLWNRGPLSHLCWKFGKVSN